MNQLERAEGKEVSLSEYQREILAEVGVESLAELDEVIEGIEAQFQDAEPNSPEERELMEQREYFKKVREQLHE